MVELSLVSDRVELLKDLNAMAECSGHTYEYVADDSAVEATVQYPQRVDPVGEVGVSIHSYGYAVAEAASNGPLISLPEGREAIAPAFVFDETIALAGNVEVRVRQVSGVIWEGESARQEFVQSETVRDIAHEVIEYLRQTEGGFAGGDFESVDAEGYEFSNIARVGYRVTSDSFNSSPGQLDIAVQLQGSVVSTLTTPGKAVPRGIPGSPAGLRYGMELWGFWPKSTGVDCLSIPGHARNDPVETMDLVAPAGEICAVQMAVFDRLQAQRTDTGFEIPASGEKNFTLPEDEAGAVVEMLSSEPTAWVVTSSRRGFNPVVPAICQNWPVGRSTLLWTSTPLECAEG